MLSLPDQRAPIEFTSECGIRKFHVQYDQFPQFEIDGLRYRVNTASEFPYVPGEYEPATIYDLVPLRPTNN